MLTNPLQHVHVSNFGIKMVPMSESTCVSKPSFVSHSSTVDCCEAGAYLTSGLNSLDAAEDFEPVQVDLASIRTALTMYQRHNKKKISMSKIVEEEKAPPK